MANAYDLSTEILRRFVESQRTEMTLADLHRSLVGRNNRLTTDDVLRTVRSHSLVNLFNVQSITNQLCVIQLSPKLVLCDACLKRRCRAIHCSMLHLCCFASHFSNREVTKKCAFPHKLIEHPNNVVLLNKFNCETLDQDLLLDLLRLHHKTSKEQTRAEGQIETKRPSPFGNEGSASVIAPPGTPTHRLRRPRASPQVKKSPVQVTTTPDNVTERQLDISIPSEKDAPDADLEFVQLVLASKGISVEQTLEKHVSNDCYRRYTFQFKDKQVVDDILKTQSVITYNNVVMKMKRTFRQRDAQLFALKFNTAKKIASSHLNLYVQTLVAKVTFAIIDMTPDGSNEQIHLIRCEQPIDYDHVYKMHSGKNALQGSRVTLAEIYEAQTLEVSYVQGSFHLPMSWQQLRKLFGETRWQRDVFACINVHDSDSADIELMNAEATQQWLADAHQIEQQLSLTVRPIIDFIQPADKKDEGEDDEEITKLLAASKISPAPSPYGNLSDPPKANPESHVYHIRPDWRMVLVHPTFGNEYQNYIRENMNLTIRIIGSSIDVSSESVRKELARHTNMFIQKFGFHEVVATDQAQVRMIKENHPRMAHRSIPHTNKTIVAARRELINELFPRPTSVAPLLSHPAIPSTAPVRPLPHPANLKQSPIPLMNLTPLTPLPPKALAGNLHARSYTIENSVHLSFFSKANSFPDRLKSYLSSKFNTKLDINIAGPNIIVLELKGEQNDVTDAMMVLTSLFKSLKVKLYSNPKDSCKFSIPDIYHVAQWILERHEIVSSCSYSPRNDGSLSIRYFAENAEFGVEEQTIEDQIFENLYDMTYQVSVTSQKLETELEELQKTIKKGPKYGQEICCWFDAQKQSTEKTRAPRFYLCGLKSAVTKMYQEAKKIGDENTPVPCDVPLPANQAADLLQFRSPELIKIEKEYEMAGVDLRSKLKGGAESQFVAPRYLHEKIRSLLLDLSRTRMNSKDSKYAGSWFDDDNNEGTASMSETYYMDPVMSAPLKTNLSTIKVSKGNLTTEQSDVLVICASSAKLYQTVVEAAGEEVLNELNGKDLTNTMIDTSTGQLKQVKRLLFVPWNPPDSYDPSQNLAPLRLSIGTFIQQAMKFAIQGKYKSIAFPAIGCGGFRIPAEFIATNMIGAVREQLMANSSLQLTVTFVVQQPNVYDVFYAKLQSTAAASTGRGLTLLPFRSPNPQD